MKRLFIESDVLDVSELRSSQASVALLLDSKHLSFPEEKVFDEVVDFAWHKPEVAWEAVKRSDEIYASSSLVPLAGYNTYTGAPVVLNVMMKKAIDENITGKSLIFIRSFDDIEWDQIDMKLLDKAFRKNFMYTLEYENGYVQKQVDIDKLIRDHEEVE